jgi:hypothetical protein
MRVFIGSVAGCEPKISLLEAIMLYGYGFIALLVILCLGLWLMRRAEDDAAKADRAAGIVRRTKAKEKAAAPQSR